MTTKKTLFRISASDMDAHQEFMRMLETQAQSNSSEWLTPISLTPQPGESIPYPIDALPSIIGAAVSAYHQYGQQPLPLIACSALSNVSLACQALANVARDKYLVSPTSVFFLVVANSGERKSAADSTFSKAIRQWQRDTIAKLEPERKIAQTMHQAWRVEKDGLLAQIRRQSLLDEDTETLRHALLKLVAKEPQKPVLPNLFFEDVTQEALADKLAHGWPSSALWTDEGGIVLGSHGMQSNAMKFIALLNRLWDGKSFTAHRKTSESFTITNRRLTVSIMMQPLILEQMLAKNGGLSRQSGFLARCCVCYPESSMGDRLYQEPPDSLAALPKFHERIVGCLDRTLQLVSQGELHPPTLALSGKAKTAWINFFNQVEGGLGNANQWQSIKDFASKAAENAARLAALFHLFNGSEGDISVECIERATELMMWHLCETKKILGAEPQTLEQEDAQKLLQFIQEKGLTETTPRNLQQLGPIRDKKRRDQAIEHLAANHYIKIVKQQKKTVLQINPKTYGKTTA